MTSGRYRILQFFIISILGVLLHFTYEWSGNNSAVGIVSAVNESVWEHLKLLFFPMLALTLWELAGGKHPSDFIQARTIGILGGMIFIVTAFYTFWGVSGRIIEGVSILIYFLGVIVALWIAHRMSGRTEWFSPYVAAAILIFLTGAFAVLTFRAPASGIFYDFSDRFM